MSKKNSRKTKGIGPGIIAFGAVFALFSMIFHPTGVGGYLAGGALSALAGIIVKIMGEGLDVSQKAPPSRVKTNGNLEKVKSDTGMPEVDALLEKGRGMIAEIRAENDQIPDSTLSGLLDQLEDKCAEIFRTVYEKPGKAGQIRKFMDYYLPTTLKMVRGYRMLDERGISGEKAENARKRIAESLKVVVGSCDKMLANLYRDDVLDLTTDIDVLEQMLKRDGLTESDLDRAAAQARQAARIDEEVTRRAAELSRQQEALRQSVQPKAQPTAESVPQVQAAAPVPQPQPQVQSAASGSRSAPQSAVYQRASSGVQERVDTMTENARNHISEVPTMDGGTYPVYNRKE